MDKLTAIKIKYDDGTYSDEIPISVLSENVEWDSTHTLVDVLGSIDVDVTGTIQDQISQLFNEKVGITQLQTYVNNQLNTDVTNWLNTYVNPVGSAVLVDKTLTIDGAAADAKIVGDNLNDIQPRIEKAIFSISDYYTGIFSPGAIITNVTSIDINCIVALNTMVHIIIPCLPEEEYFISSASTASYRAWAVLADDKITRLAVAPSQTTLKNSKIVIPDNGAYLVVNSKNDYDYKITKGYQIEDNYRLENEYPQILNAISGIDVYPFHIGCINNTNTTVNIDNIVYNKDFLYTIIPCQQGDKFTLTGSSKGNYRLWSWVKENGARNGAAQPNISEENLILTAPQAAYLIINVLKDNPYSIYKGEKNLNTKIENLGTTINELEENIINTVNSKIDGKQDSSALLYGFSNNISNLDAWEQGMINGETGAKSPSTTALTPYRVRTKNFLTFNEVQQVICTAGYIHIYRYDLEENFIDYISNNKDFTLSSEYKYRIVFAWNSSGMGNSQIIPSDAVEYVKLLKDPFIDNRYRKFIPSMIKAPKNWYLGRNEDYTIFTRSTQYDDFILNIQNLISNETEGYAKIENIGLSSNNKNMYAITLTPTYLRQNHNQTYITRQPKVIIVAGQHGFEKTSCYASYYLIKDLIENYAKDPILTWMRAHITFIIVPSANPYGFDNLVRKNANGVDLNRNWSPNEDPETNPDSAYYSGETPFDQPETQNIKNIIDNNKDALLLLDFHTNGSNKAPNWNNVNWLSFGYRQYTDNYFFRMFETAYCYLMELDVNLRGTYNLQTNGNMIGTISFNNKSQLSSGTLGGYSGSVNILGHTFEGNNGFPSEDSSFSPNSQKANSEMLGNYIKTIVSEMTDMY